MSDPGFVMRDSEFKILRIAHPVVAFPPVLIV